ncbi:hypothetical protein F4680DRAFT_445786 [Xylaria scruposa]|nr:hypothetical protein F4680DRAFT_445786 [Xylaria scruposa]
MRSRPPTSLNTMKTIISMSPTCSLAMSTVANDSTIFPTSSTPASISASGTSPSIATNPTTGKTTTITTDAAIVTITPTLSNSDITTTMKTNSITGTTTLVLTITTASPPAPDSTSTADDELKVSDAYRPNLVTPFGPPPKPIVCHRLGPSALTPGFGSRAGREITPQMVRRLDEDMARDAADITAMLSRWTMDRENQTEQDLSNEADG